MLQTTGEGKSLDLDVAAVPLERDVMRELERRITVLNSPEHTDSEYSASVKGSFKEAVIWLAIAGVMWIFCLVYFR